MDLITTIAEHAENCVVASLLHDATLIDDVMAEVRVQDFLQTFNKDVYETILTLHKQRDVTIELLNVTNAMAQKRYQQNDVLIKLSQLMTKICSTYNAIEYAKIVKREATKRNLFSIFQQAQEKLTMFDEDHALAYIHTAIAEIENDDQLTSPTYHDLLEATLTKMQDEYLKKSILTGVSTGFKDIDAITNGLQPGNMIVLGARPSMGKTLLALNMADNIALMQKQTCVFFSLEMPAHELVKRSISRFSGVEGQKVFTNQLNEHDWQRISLTSTIFDSSKLFINDKCRLNSHEMRAFCRKVKNKHGLGAIFIDYIGLMDGEGETETVKLGNISVELKAIAKDFNVPVVVLAQLNRGVEQRQDKRPMMSDIRQSGNIEQDADLIMFLYRDDYYNEHSVHKNVAELLIEKHRNGRTGTVLLKTNFKQFEFLDYER